MVRPGGVEYDHEKLDHMFDEFLADIQDVLTRLKVTDVESFLSDFHSLTKAEFMRRYGVSEREYNELQAALQELEDLNPPTPEDGKDLAQIIWFMGLAVVYLARDIERDTEIQAYRQHAEAHGRELYLNWVTMGDDHVCETCQDYEDGSPYRVEEFPHIPHPFCRCHPEPCDENGRPIDDLSEYSGSELEYYDEIMEDFGDVGIDFEAVPPPPPYYYI